MFDNTVPAVSTLFPDAGKEVMSIVLDMMKLVGMVYDVDFRDLLVAHEDVAGG